MRLGWRLLLYLALMAAAYAALSSLLPRTLTGQAVVLLGSALLAGSLLLLAIVSFAVRARRRPIVSGSEGLLAERAEAVEAFETRGLVRVHGELWEAASRAPVRAGQRVRILSRDGLTLLVEPESE